MLSNRVGEAVVASRLRWEKNERLTSPLSRQARQSALIIKEAKVMFNND